MELHVVAATEAFGKGVVLNLQLRDLKGRKRNGIIASPRHGLGERGQGLLNPRQVGWEGKYSLQELQSSLSSGTDHSRWAFPWNAPQEKYLLSTASRFSQACPITNMWDCSRTFFSGENFLSENSYFHFAAGTERASLLGGPGMEVRSEQILTSIFSSMHR